MTDLERTPSGGGSYAVNWHAFDEIAKRFEAHYAGPIVPKLPLIDDVVSKVRRKILNRPGRYVYFSAETLDENARMVGSHIARDSDAVVFRSAARWCRCRSTVPYFVYLDAVVHTFFYNTFDEKDFQSEDLRRIWREEAAFLENAEGVFFESDWGLRLAREAYRLEGNHYVVARRGAAVEPPAEDAWDGSLRLVTMAMNFRQKGGDLVAEAFRQLKTRYPSLTWHIVGGPPDFEPESIPGVTYEGELRPSESSDRDRLRTLLSSAFLFLHPTREDTSPLVITEAAYFGCPSISTNAFAIPELIVDGETGLLLGSPADATGIAIAVEQLITDRERYLAMRKAARSYSLANFRWDLTGSIICDHIDRVIGR